MLCHKDSDYGAAYCSSSAELALAMESSTAAHMQVFLVGHNCYAYDNMVLAYWLYSLQVLPGPPLAASMWTLSPHTPSSARHGTR